MNRADLEEPQSSNFTEVEAEPHVQSPHASSASMRSSMLSSMVTRD